MHDLAALTDIITDRPINLGNKSRAIGAQCWQTWNTRQRMAKLPSQTCLLDMSDVTFIDRLTLKRNRILEKRLQVRLQIMGEEYRMVRIDMEQHTRDLADFLVYVNHTVPGLNAYCQPDSRSMRNAAMKRRSQNGKKNTIEKSSHRQIYNIEAVTDKYESVGGKEHRGGSSANRKKGQENCNCLLHYPDSSSKTKLSSGKEYRCRLRCTMNKKDSASVEYENNEPRKTSACSCYGQESFEGARSSASLYQGHRAQSAKYGRSVCAQKDEMLRNKIFSRFDAIFDLRSEKRPGKLSYTTLASVSDDFNNKDILEAATSSPVREHRQHTSYTKDTPSANQIVRNRLTWSAPHRHHITSTRPETSQLSVGSLPPDCLPSCSDPAEMQTAQHIATSLLSVIALDEHDADFKSRVGQQFQKRPKTAPPNYELKQKSVTAPRQQVAGFQAVAHSRRVDTRAILKKSRQLQEMVKLLAPLQQSDDSSSD